MFVVRFFTKIDKTLPHYQKSSAQVLQSAPGKLGSGAANRSVNLDLIYLPYILWPRSVRAGSDSSSPDPRPVVARSQPLSCDLRRRRTSSTRRRPTLYPSSLARTRRRPTQYPSSGVAYPSSRVADPSSRVVDPLSRAASRHRALQTHRWAVRTRRRALTTRRRDPFRARPAPVRARFIIPRTPSEHPGLHLPRRLLVGFSKGCFIFFIARHPPRLEFREHSAVKSALVILNYLEIKHCFFFSLGILALE